MKSQKKKGLSRAEAAELYGDLRKALNQMKGGQMPPPSSKGVTGDAAKQIASEIKKALAKDSPTPLSSNDYSLNNSLPSYETGPSFPMFPSNIKGGQMAAVMFVVLFGIVRLTLSALEAFGVVGIKDAEATIQQQTRPSPGIYSKEEMKVLTSLDARRSELSEKGKLIEDRERELDSRDREFAVRVSQLKELTDKLKTEREKNDKKRSSQLEQLANVYGSMSPQEAAQLIEQLDVTIALSLIEKMPEKKIGQILAMMSKERALMLTKMLSAR